MKIINKGKLIAVLALSFLVSACVTETVDHGPSIKFSEAAVISVQDPSLIINTGASFAWLPQAIYVYKDERIQDEQIKKVLEAEIVIQLEAKDMLMVDSVNGAKYSIAYTAALESALADETIVRRFGLLPGNEQIPTNDSNIEKGTLVIYVFNNATDQVIWRSAAQVGVRFDMAMSERKERIQRIVGEMFQTFPVKHAQ